MTTQDYIVLEKTNALLQQLEQTASMLGEFSQTARSDWLREDSEHLRNEIEKKQASILLYMRGAVLNQ